MLFICNENSHPQDPVDPQSLMQYVMEEKYIPVPRVLTMMNRRRERSAGDISASNKTLKTVENKLTSLVKYLANNLEKRLEGDPNSKVIGVMANCLDLKDIIEYINDKQKNNEMEKNIKELCKMANYDEELMTKTEAQYKEFKYRVNQIVITDGIYNELIGRFEHMLFELHFCSEQCEKKSSKKRKIKEELIAIPLRVVHLMLKEPILYSDIEEFLHLYLTL